MSDETDPLEDPLQGPTTMAGVRPSWADPRYCVATSWTRQTLPTLPTGTVTRLVAANPTRWAIGFSLPSGAQAPVNLFVGTSLPTMVFAIAQPGVLIWFNLFTNGPLPTLDWWGGAANIQQIVVTEILIQ